MEGIDWVYIILAGIALASVLFIGGYYWKLKKEITELVDAIVTALEDNTVTKKELDRIIAEGQDVGKTIKELTLSVLGLLKK